MALTPKRKLVMGIVLFLGVILAFGIYRYSLKEDPSSPVESQVLAEGDSMPNDLPLVTLHGGTDRSWKDYKDSVVLINYWASWCGPCVREMPSIYKLHEKFKSRGFKVVAVAMDDDPKDAEQFLLGKFGKPSFDLFRGNDQPIFELFAINGIPFSVLVDKKGKIQFARAGEVDWNDPAAVKMVETIL
jgi:thiol-disulfide isomerase/thioredoxin